MKINQPHCINCRFYDDLAGKPEFEGMQVGYCRRYAPRPFTVRNLKEEIDDLTWAHYPLMLDNDFCGEFESKPEEAAKMLQRQKIQSRS